MHVKQPTALDVAKLAGVSRSAVSRVFTPGTSVSPKTRRKVLEAAEFLGYRVNFLARSLTMQRTELVAIVVSNLDHSLRANLIEKLSLRLVARGYRPFLVPWSKGNDVKPLLDMMLHYNVSGTIITSDTPPGDIAKACLHEGLPLVLIEKAPLRGLVANVVHNHEMAGRLAAEELYNSGCRTVVYAGMEHASYSIKQRKIAFTRACAEYGVTISSEFLVEAAKYESGKAAATAFLKTDATPDGFYCCNDFLALGFIDQIRQSGTLKIPNDAKLVACDDIPEAAWQSYQLTTIRQDQDKVAEAAVDALEICIGDASQTKQPKKLDVELIRRETTRTNI